MRDVASAACFTCACSQQAWFTVHGAWYRRAVSVRCTPALSIASRVRVDSGCAPGVCMCLQQTCAASVREHAVLAVQSLLEQLLLRIHVVEDGICVDLMARREQDDLVVLARLDEALDDKRPDIDPSVHRLFARKVDFYYDISLSLFNVIDAMNQSFIHVENRQLFLIGMLGLR